MNLTKTSAELKCSSRELLLGKYGRMISAYLVMQFLPNIIALMAGRVLPGGTAGMVIALIVELMIALVTGVLMLGQSKFYMDFVTNRETPLSTIFYGFHNRTDIGIKLIAIFGGIALACMLPFIASAVIYSRIGEAFMFPIMALFLILGLVIAIRKLIYFSQSFYLAIDFPEYNLRQLLKMSTRIMKGQCGRYFYLQISFLPLMLLCIPSLGLGFLWLYPYKTCTEVQFYMDLMDYHTRQMNA